MDRDLPAATTRLLAAMRGGDASAGEELLSLVYDELRRLAARMLGKDRGATLQATALVHEAWLKLSGGNDACEDQRHFVRVAAKAMRSVLIDRYRGRHADKRGGGARRVTLGEEPAAEQVADLVGIAESLERLGRLDPELEQIVELRFFAGLSQQEIATNLGKSLRSVERGWQLARAWLASDLGGDGG